MSRNDPRIKMVPRARDEELLEQIRMYEEGIPWKVIARKFNKNNWQSIQISVFNVLKTIE